MRSTLSNRRSAALRVVSVFSCLALVSLSIPYGAFRFESPVQGLEVSSATNLSNKLTMLKGQPGVRAQGTGGVNVESKQKLLAVFLTDLNGEHKEPGGVKISLTNPAGTIVAQSKLTSTDTLLDQQVKAYQDRIIELANLRSMTDPDAMAARVVKTMEANPMDLSLRSGIENAAIKLKTQSNLVIMARNEVTKEPTAMLVINPTPGTWRLTAGGSDREGYYACLAAGETYGSLSVDQQLWVNAVSGFKISTIKASISPSPTVSALATSMSCTMCKAIVLIIYGYIGLASGALIAAFLVGTGGLGVLLAALIVGATISIVAAGTVSRSLLPRAVCQSVGMCR